MAAAAPIRAPSFDEVLDDIVEEARIAASENARRHRDVHADMDWIFQLLAMAAEGGGSAAQGGTWEEGLALPGPRDDEASVAAELGLSQVRSLSGLAEVRRKFALRNHPDRLHASLQAYATRRMKIANMLIDQRRKELIRAA